MAKNITHAYVVTQHTSGSAHNNIVQCTVEMPASEFAAFRVLAGMTDAIPTGEAAAAALASDTNAPA